jgi:hypothetical protein
MLVGLFAPDKGFVYIHDAHEFAEIRVFHSSAEPHAHIPSRFIGSATDEPINLMSTDAFFCW